MQRGLIDGLVTALVAADAEFTRMARGERDGTPERLATFLNTARTNLQTLGLYRRPTKAVDIAEFLEQAWRPRPPVPGKPFQGSRFKKDS